MEIVPIDLGVVGTVKRVPKIGSHLILTEGRVFPLIGKVFRVEKGSFGFKKIYAREKNGLSIFCVYLKK